MSAVRESPRLLFVPVSGPFGMGEYARSLGIARAVRARWPQADIRFLLSREAPYAADAPVAATLLPASPTLCSTEVIAAIGELRPDVVIFDNAGRTAQLRAARAAGAAIVFISARPRQRRRAARLRWLRLIDEHWIAYPQLFAAAPGPLEGLKRRLAGRPAPRYLDVVLPPADPARRAALLNELDLDEAPALVVPGGGTGHPGADGALEAFRASASAIAAAGTPTLYVGPGGDASSATLRCRASLPQPDLIEAMRAARLVIANGGSTMLQAIASGAACIAVPIAADQRAR
ncbi:MAG: hypothetical protein KGL34_06380, partial [Gammaproteobacteria bacterium]|nr:hypothetical protein [Gammaproteobacteria bacterium]